MTLHREGTNTILLVTALACLAGYAAWRWLPGIWVLLAVLPFVAVWLVVLWFFRLPKRAPITGADLVTAPADGKVVVIEEVQETEYFKDKRLQVSIFMSPLNVHANWYPVSGSVSYAKYHPGLYLVAWHPKSSTENERSTIVVKRSDGSEVLFRQIAGALARRICTYAHTGQAAAQGGEFGFIKFGSRVDLFLPLNAQVQVRLGQHVAGTQTIIAKLP
ncbi:MAG: phosphatidylserine decarboxylase family protein [Flavobacteriales bacterium]|nr:phosphatidylserine decarboxylase family protein [Flavobacteriales bacterium]